MDIVEQQPCNRKLISELISAVQNYPAAWYITIKSYRDLHKENSRGKI